MLFLLYFRACSWIRTCFHFLPGFGPFRGGIPRSVEIGKFILNSALDPSESPDSDIFTKHFQTFSNSALARRYVMSIIQIRSKSGDLLKISPFGHAQPRSAPPMPCITRISPIENSRPDSALCGEPPLSRDNCFYLK